MYKVSDIIKLDLNAILEVWTEIPFWYSNESYCITKVGLNTVFLDRPLLNLDLYEICVMYIKLDISKIRKDKLNKLSLVKMEE